MNQDIFNDRRIQWVWSMSLELFKKNFFLGFGWIHGDSTVLKISFLDTVHVIMTFGSYYEPEKINYDAWNEAHPTLPGIAGLYNNVYITILFQEMCLG